MRDEILKTFAAARGRAGRRAAARGREVERALRLRPHASTTPRRSPRRSRASCAIDRSYDTLNDALPRLRRRSRPRTCRPRRAKYFTDARLVVTTLSKEPLPEAIGAAAAARALRSRAAPARRRRLAAHRCRRPPLPQLDVKLLFDAGSAHDPQGKEGLAALAAVDDRRGRLAASCASTRSRRRSSRWRAASTRRSTRR